MKILVVGVGKSVIVDSGIDVERIAKSEFSKTDGIEIPGKRRFQIYLRKVPLWLILFPGAESLRKQGNEIGN